MRLSPFGDSYVRIGGRDYPLRNWTESGFLAGPFDGALVPGQRAKVKLVVRDWHDRDGPLRIDNLDVQVLRTDRYGLAARFYRPERYKVAALKSHYDLKRRVAA